MPVARSRWKGRVSEVGAPSDAPLAVTEHGVRTQGDRLGHREHVDVVPGVPPAQAWLRVHAVLRSERQVDPAHTLVRTDVADTAFGGERAVHAKAELSHPDFFVGLDLRDHAIEIRGGIEDVDHLSQRYLQ